MISCCLQPVGFATFATKDDAEAAKLEMQVRHSSICCSVSAAFTLVSADKRGLPSDSYVHNFNCIQGLTSILYANATVDWP